MKRIAGLLITPLFIATMMLSAFPRQVQAAFNQNLLIDDVVFNDSNSMTSAQIDAFLNTFPNSCISPNSGFEAKEPSGYSPSGGFTYGSFVTAGRVIATSAQAYGLNPQALIVTLEKEQSLVTGRSSTTYCYGTEHKYAASMGYGCPDSGGSYSWTGVSLYRRSGVEHTATGSTCVNSAAKSGFSQQIIRAAWLLKFSQERSLGHTDWAVIEGSWDNTDDLSSCYSGYMTQGTFKRCPDGPAEYYDGWATIDSTATHMDTGATAALYRYTPHFHGNQNFVSLFEGWFGSTISATYYQCHNAVNVSGAPSGAKVMAYQYQPGRTSLAFTQLNNTGSACAEVHVWNPGYQTWATNVATGMAATNPSDGALVGMKLSVNSLLYLRYSGGNGLVEVHRFGPHYKLPGFYDVPVNLKGVNSTTGTFVSGDFLGRGYAQLMYVLYNGTGGKVETHMFDSTLTKAVGFRDMASDLTGVSSSTGTFVAGDFFGRGYAQLAYVLYNGSGGKVEVHVFDPTLSKAIGYYDVPTDLTGVSATSGTFVAGDFLGRGYDQLAYVLYNGSGGKVEVHTFTQDLRRAIGFQDIVTNLPGFDPTQ